MFETQINVRNIEITKKNDCLFNSDFSFVMLFQKFLLTNEAIGINVIIKVYLFMGRKIFQIDVKIYKAKMPIIFNFRKSLILIFSL
jgi:hypothetical protein